MSTKLSEKMSIIQNCQQDVASETKEMTEEEKNIAKLLTNSEIIKAKDLSPDPNDEELLIEKPLEI